MGEDRSFRLKTIAENAGGRVVGDGDATVRGIAPLRDAGPDDLGLLADPRYVRDAVHSAAGALLVATALEAHLAEDPRPRVVVDDPYRAMVPLLEALDPTPTYAPGVHPTAVLESGVVLGADVSVGPYAVIEAGARIGEGTRVGAHCVVGRDARLGAGCRLHPHVVVYANTVLGDRVTVHAGSRLGVDGFGYAFHDGAYLKVPQVGRVVIGDDVEIGANTVLDRGSIGDTTVGTGTKLDNLIQIGHNTRIGNHVAMAAQCGISGSTTIEDYVQMGGQSASTGHLTIGKGTRMSPRAVPISDVEPGSTLMGYPARDQKEHMRIYAAQAKLPDLIRKVRRLEQEIARLGNAPAETGDETGDEAGRGGGGS